MRRLGGILLLLSAEKGWWQRQTDTVYPNLDAGATPLLIAILVIGEIVSV
jgi:hypothetical protein